MNSFNRYGRLVIISGPPGVGKSSLARKLAREFGLFLIDKDLIDEPFSPNERGAHYTQHIEPKVLQAMIALGKENILLGHSVIFDLPLSHILLNSPEWKEKFLSIDNTKHPLILELMIEEQILRQRIKQRGLQRDQIKLTEEGWQHFKQSDRLGEVNPLAHHLLNASLSENDLYRAAKAILSANLTT